MARSSASFRRPHSAKRATANEIPPDMHAMTMATVLEVITFPEWTLPRSALAKRNGPDAMGDRDISSRRLTCFAYCPIVVHERGEDHREGRGAPCDSLHWSLRAEHRESCDEQIVSRPPSPGTALPSALSSGA
jgi:hypothetical protein